VRSMLDWSSLASGASSQKPFYWMGIPQSFRRNDAVRLSASFPRGGFSQSIGRDGRYRLAERTIIEGRERVSISDLPAEWLELMDDFLSERYQTAIQDALGFQLQSTALRVRLYRYESGDWMMPHTDPPDRLTTHLIYMSEGWRTEHGGELLLLNSNQKEDVSHVLAPEFNTAVLFRPSERTFHAVRPMRSAGSWTRLAVIAQFINRPEPAA